MSSRDWETGEKHSCELHTKTGTMLQYLFNAAVLCVNVCAVAVYSTLNVFRNERSKRCVEMYVF